MNITTRKVVVAGVLSAISILLSVTLLGFIPWLSAASLTIMHVPVIVGAILEGPLVGFLVGLVFGVSSLVQAAVAPRTPGDVLFTNPLVSVLPRLFIGPVAWLVYKVLKAAQERQALIVASLAGGFANLVLLLVLLAVHRAEEISLDSSAPWVLIAVALVLSALLQAWLVSKILHGDKEPVTLTVASVAGSLTNTVLVLGMLGLLRKLPWAIMPPIVLFNALPEAIAAAIITVAVVLAWKRIEIGRKGSTV
jgi:uncharacterized membrane protein